MRRAERKFLKYVNRKRHKGKMLERGKGGKSPATWGREMVSVGGRSMLVQFAINGDGAAIPRTIRIETGGGLIKPGKQDMEAILLHLQKRV